MKSISKFEISQNVLLLTPASSRTLIYVKLCCFDQLDIIIKGSDQDVLCIWNIMKMQQYTTTWGETPIFPQKSFFHFGWMFMTCLEEQTKVFLVLFIAVYFRFFCIVDKVQTVSIIDPSVLYYEDFLVNFSFCTRWRVLHKTRWGWSYNMLKASKIIPPS